MIQDRIDQARMIENGIARFDIAQKIDERNLIRLRTRQRAYDKVEIGSGKPRPTIRTNHRDFIMRGEPAHGKSTFFGASAFHRNGTFRRLPDSAAGFSLLPMQWRG